jgi:hypothetical protein
MLIYLAGLLTVGLHGTEVILSAFDQNDLTVPGVPRSSELGGIYM